MHTPDQWRVTEYGLETVEGPRREYFMTPAELVSVRDDGDGPIYEFIVDMGVKTWIDPDSFVAAYEEALEAHESRLPRPVDATILARSKNAFRAAVTRSRRPNSPGA